MIPVIAEYPVGKTERPEAIAESITAQENAKPRNRRPVGPATKRVHGIPVREFLSSLFDNPRAEYAAKPNGAFIIGTELATVVAVTDIRMSRTFVVLNNHHVYDLAGFIAVPVGGN